MADSKQLEILKKGVNEWNKWRRENPELEIDLSDASLRETDLSNVNLSDANLHSADLWKTDLRRANLRKATLWSTDLVEADLIEADLAEANLWLTDLWLADLSNANLSEADLFASKFVNTNLYRANFSKAVFSDMIIGNSDLSEAVNLSRIKHDSPTVIGIDTLRLSKGKIPEAFLRGCGLSDWEIESSKLYTPGLSNEEIINIKQKVFELSEERQLQILHLFISYSHKDGAFVDKLEPCFTSRGIRFWRDDHDLKAGRLEKQIDRAIRFNPTVLLVLSKESIQSDWVEHEVKSAREMEKEINRDVLCPVALDEEWKKPSGSWSQVLMDQVMKYNILDFSHWEDDASFNTLFERLVEGLDLFYKN